MESILGFNDGTMAIMDIENQQLQQEEQQQQTSSTAYKLVPWLNWDEWARVRDSLFSDSPQCVTFALNRISTWRSRGCLPVVIDVTASFIEIQQKDRALRKDLPDDALLSDQMLAMLYSMAILRLVNCVVEKTRRKNEISIAEAADAIGISRTLIDIRHESSHRDLPALDLLRDSALKAIDWLKSYYWEPQKQRIPFQKDGTAAVRKEIKSKLCELVSCIRVKLYTRSEPAPIKGRRAKHLEKLCSCSKFFTTMASQLHSSKSVGSKKQITRISKSLVRLYSSFSSELISELLEFLFKALSSSNYTGLPNIDQIDKNTNTLLDDWKSVIIKLADKEPELLLMLLKGILIMIETKEGKENGKGTYLTPSECNTGACQIEQLSSLFLWLVEQLKALKHIHSEDADRQPSAGMNISNAILMVVLRKCLLLSCDNKPLLQSAQHIASMMGQSSLVQKVNRLSLLILAGSDGTEDNPPITSSLQEEELIHEASKKLEMIKLEVQRRKIVKEADVGVVSSGRWTIAKSWNPCPIGMLPRELGSSGRYPVLDHHCDGERTGENSFQSEHTDSRGDLQPLDSQSVGTSGSKRNSSSDICLLDTSNTKKTKQTAKAFESVEETDMLLKGVQGHLMIDGVWKMVGHDELLAIQSDVNCWF